MTKNSKEGGKKVCKHKWQIIPAPYANGPFGCGGAGVSITAVCIKCLFKRFV